MDAVSTMYLLMQNLQQLLYIHTYSLGLCVIVTVHLPNFSAAMRRSDCLCNYQFNRGIYIEIQAHLTMHMDVEVFSKILILTQHRPFW